MREPIDADLDAFDFSVEAMHVEMFAAPLPPEPAPPITTAAPSAPTAPHASYLGASDIAALVGVDPFRTPLDVWAEKTGRVVVPTSEEMHAGNEHEPAIALAYARRCRSELEGISYPGPGTLRAPRDQWRGATPDCLAWRRGHPRVAQLKLVGLGMAARWGTEDEGPEGAPHHVHLQVHWEALHVEDVLGVRIDVADVVASIGTETRVYEIPIDREAIEELLDLARDWWRAHVEGGEMPEPGPRDLETLGALYPRPRGVLIPATADALDLVQQYVDARAYAVRAAETRDAVAAQLRAAIGDGLGWRGPWGRVAWTPTTRATVDWQAVAHELGASRDLIEKHTRKTTSRRLGVSWKGARGR